VLYPFTIILLASTEWLTEAKCFPYMQYMLTEVSLCSVLQGFSVSLCVLEVFCSTDSQLLPVKPMAVLLL
jgi:hypothetical protein